MRAPRARFRSARLATLAIVMLAVAAAAAGIARSTSSEPIPDANGVIHACHKNPIGPVSIVYSAANCGPGQLPIEWNQAGVQGPQGETGPPGPQGPRGLPGAAGDLEFFTASRSFPSPPLELDPVTERGVFVTLGEPGTYWLMATGEVSYFPQNAAPGRGTCDLQYGADQERIRLTFDVGFDTVKTFAISDVRVVTEPAATALAFCREGAGSDPLTLHSMRIVALRVG